MTSSPGFPNSNGKVESAVKTAKTLICKASNDKRDPWLAILSYRNTPTPEMPTSPMQPGRRDKIMVSGRTYMYWSGYRIQWLKAKHVNRPVIKRNAMKTEKGNTFYKVTSLLLTCPTPQVFNCLLDAD